MAENETKHEKFLKRAQLWVAVLAGVVTFIVGAYNAKNVLFTKKGPGVVQVFVHAENGQPISEASVEILKVQGGVVSSSNTDSSGRFEGKQLEPANYTLKISKVNFQPETLFFTIDPGSTAQLDLKLKPVVNSIRSTVEEVGSSWLKKFGAPAK